MLHLCDAGIMKNSEYTANISALRIKGFFLRMRGGLSMGEDEVDHFREVTKMISRQNYAVKEFDLYVKRLALFSP